MDMFQDFKARWSRSKQSQRTRDGHPASSASAQRARDASCPLPSTSTSISNPLAASISPASSMSNVPWTASSARGGSISLTNPPAVDPPTISVNADDLASAPVGITDSSTRRVESHPPAIPSKPCEGDGRKPFVRLAGNRMEDELNMLDYSNTISDSPRLCSAVKVAGSLVELVQVSTHSDEFGALTD
jgi:hypothetical protein